MKTLKTKSILPEEIIDVLPTTTEEKKLFRCPDEACTKEYRFLSHLELHQRIGNHKYIEKCQTLADASMKMYKEKVDSVELTSKPVIQATDSSCNFDLSLLEGWALQK